MANLTRYTQKIFAQNSNSKGQFGSAINNTRVTSDNVETLQALTNYLNGWSTAIITNQNYPSWQEMDGVLYGLSYQQAYMFQNGIPEYDDGTEYKIGSIVKKTGTFELYGSLANDNTGNPLSDTSKWNFLVDLSNVFKSTHRIGELIWTLENRLYENEIWLQGQIISRTTYADLFAVYGTTYGGGDGSTTFQLPDFRNRVAWGTSGGSWGYLSAGLPDHAHQRGTMNITGHFQVGSGNPILAAYGDGAFSTYSSGSIDKYGDGASTGNKRFSFNAANNWSGETTWASYYNGIYGGSSTVQPPAIKVQVKTRYA